MYNERIAAKVQIFKSTKIEKIGKDFKHITFFN